MIQSKGFCRVGRPGGKGDIFQPSTREKMNDFPVHFRVANEQKGELFLRKKGIDEVKNQMLKRDSPKEERALRAHPLSNFQRFLEEKMERAWKRMNPTSSCVSLFDLSLNFTFSENRAIEPCRHTSQVKKALFAEVRIERMFERNGDLCLQFLQQVTMRTSEILCAKVDLRAIAGRKHHRRNTRGQLLARSCNRLPQTQLCRLVIDP